MRRTKGTLAIDFDGTIVEHAYPAVGPLKKNVVDVINGLYEKWEIIIWTCRNNPTLNPDKRYLDDVRRCLDSNGIKYDRIDVGAQGKVLADFYIDDRAVAFTDNWAEIKTMLDNQ